MSYPNYPNQGPYVIIGLSLSLTNDAIFQFNFMI